MCNSKSHWSDRRVSRREVLQWVAASGALLGVAVLTGCDEVVPEPPRNQRIAVSKGCYSVSYAGANNQQIGCGLVNTLGNPVLDSEFFAEVQLQSWFWQGIPASVYAFDECGAERANALAHPNGFILMGYWLMQNVLRDYQIPLPYAGVLAHEWGHQIQFRFNWMSHTEPTVRRTELEADAFSGYYMALAKSWAGSYLETYFQLLNSLGDTNFNDPSHHGTGQERAAAGALGMQIAFQAMQRGYPFSYDELHSIFTTTITSLLVQEAAPQDLYVSRVARDVLQHLDLEYLQGVLAGKRSLEELEAPPSTPEERQKLFPVMTSIQRASGART